MKDGSLWSTTPYALYLPGLRVQEGGTSIIADMICLGLQTNCEESFGRGLVSGVKDR